MAAGSDMDKTDEALIARHLRNESTDTLEAEVERLRALPEATRSTALARLREIDRFLGLDRQTHDDADDAASRLSMSRRNFYRLISRMREHGPVLGLAPNARGKPKPSAAREGLDELAEASLKRLLAERPDAAVSTAMEAIARAFVEARSSAKPPSAMTVRGRLAELRKPGGWLDQNRWQTGCTFGRKILIDQCAVTSRAVSVDRDFALTFVVDVETRLVLGCGAGDFFTLSDGLSSAVRFARRAADRLVVGEFPVAERPERIRWVVPDELWGGMGQVKEEFAAQGADLSTVSTGKQRHGQRLLELLGPEFDVFRLTPRAVGGKPASFLDVPSDFDPERISSAIKMAVERWNYRVLEGASRLPRATLSATTMARLDDWRSRQPSERVAKLVDMVATPFEHVTDRHLDLVVRSERANPPWP